MNTFISMAWRNIWRNKRRSLITMASIFFAVFSAILMRSFQLGTYNHMIKQTIEMYSGYIQVQHPDYLNDPSLENVMEFRQGMLDTLMQIENVEAVVPRIESFALASSGLQSKGVLLQGIDPELEKNLSNPERNLIRFQLTPKVAEALKAALNLTDEQTQLLQAHQHYNYHQIDRMAFDLKITSEQLTAFTGIVQTEAQYLGEYLNKGDNGVLVSSRLARFLKVNVGDTLVLMGQGYQGTSAAGLFRIKGIVKMPAPDLDNKVVYMDLTTCQKFLGLEQHITTLSVNLENPKKMPHTQRVLSDLACTQKASVKNWQEFNPIMKQQIEGDNLSGKMFVAILYFIIFFGIFGTVMMMIAERQREFGVMVAIGMKKRVLALVLVTEMLLMGALGTFSGVLATSPIVAFFNYNPIRIGGEMGKAFEEMGFEPVMPMAWFDAYFVWQATVILIMVLLACLIPIQKIHKLNIINALKS